MLLPHRAVVALAAAPLLLLGACSGAGEPADDPSADPSATASGTPSETPTETPDPSPSQPAPANGEQYVALGDSYTAAPLVPTTDSSDACLQSDGNYPHLVADELGYQLRDVSCAGATTTSLIGVQELTGGDTRPAQFDAIGPGTDLVTVSVGANDGALFSTLVQRCLQLAEQDPQGSPCADQQRSGGGDDLARLTGRLATRTAAVVAGVRDRAPQAQVVVVTYPQLVPDRGRCEDLPLAAGDYAYARQVNEDLADGLADGARRADADLVDLYSLSAGHDICSDDPWVNGRVTDGGRALAFHPFAVEQQAVADEVVDLVQADDTASG